jgi:adenine-specific DNA-methyltransferase
MRYIGSKARILDFIYDTVTRTFGSINEAVVADLFAGTCCVSEMFKNHNARIITNDYLQFSYVLQIAKIKLNTEPCCSISYIDAIKQLNQLDGIEGFFFKEYTLEGSEKLGMKRNYFSESNARKIDSICLKMNEWKFDGLISEDMFFLLSANLIDAITKVSNTSGTYGAFLKIDDQRKYKDLELMTIDFINNYKANEAHCLDIIEIIDNIHGDILYLDPPYNERQYPPYYHILETAALYDTPPIYGITGRRPYQKLLSPFCMKEKALPAMLDIVKRAQFTDIYISYSTDGIINHKDFYDQLTAYGDVMCFSKPYRRYKSNSGCSNGEEKVKEIIFYVKKC